MSVIEVKMSAIYHAAHDVLPAKATAFAQQAGHVTDAIQPVAAETASAGNHPIGGDLSDLAVELFWHLREMVRTLNDSATGLDRLADDLVAVDGEAAAWFDRHRQYVGDPTLAPEPAAPQV